MAIDPQAFMESHLSALRSGFFKEAPILEHVAALAMFRAAQRLIVVPPKVPEHVASDITAAFRNVAIGSQIPEVRAGASYLSVASRAAELRAATARCWPNFFAPPHKGSE